MWYIILAIQTTEGGWRKCEQNLVRPISWSSERELDDPPGLWQPVRRPGFTTLDIQVFFVINRKNKEYPH